MRLPPWRATECTAARCWAFWADRAARPAQWSPVLRREDLLLERCCANGDPDRGTRPVHALRAGSRAVFVSGASGSPLPEDRRQLCPGGGDEEEEAEKGQEDYGKSAATVAVVHGELLVGAPVSATTNRAATWYSVVVCHHCCLFSGERDRFSTTPIQSQRRKGHRGFGMPSASHLHRCPVVSSAALLPRPRPKAERSPRTFA